MPQIKTNQAVLSLLLDYVGHEPKVANARIASCVNFPYPTYTAFNSLKTHPLQARWKDREQRIHLHAEIGAIIKYARGNFTNLKDQSLYVARLNSFGAAMAFPCEGCLGAIDEFGIHEVIYTRSPTTFGVWRRDSHYIYPL